MGKAVCVYFPLGVVFPRGSLLSKWEIRASFKWWQGDWDVCCLRSWTDTQGRGRPWLGTWSFWSFNSWAPETCVACFVMFECSIPTADLSNFFFHAVPDPLWREEGDRLGFRQQVNMSFLKPLTIKSKKVAREDQLLYSASAARWCRDWMWRSLDSYAVTTLKYFHLPLILLLGFRSEGITWNTFLHEVIFRVTYNDENSEI